MKQKLNSDVIESSVHINENMTQIQCYVILYNANTHAMYIMKDIITYQNTKHSQTTVINVSKMYMIVTVN